MEREPCTAVSHAVSRILIKGTMRKSANTDPFCLRKSLKGDHLILEKLHLDENEKEYRTLIVQMEKE